MGLSGQQTTTGKDDEYHFLQVIEWGLIDTVRINYDYSNPIERHS